MAQGSPAPDLFAALAWSERVAPPVDGPGDAASSAALGPAADIVADRTPMPSFAAVSPSASDFGALADALEPAADVSPVLDEFEGLLDVFDEAPAFATPPAATPPAATPPKTAVRPPAASPRRPTPVIGTLPLPPPRSLADLPRRANDFPSPGDPAVSAQLAQVGPEPSSAQLSRVLPQPDDESPTPRRGMPAVWIVSTLMLGGALAYVLATQTDLFTGDVIERRNAEVQVEAEREAELAQANLDATRVEYGTIEIDSEPKGARVFEVRDGPQARFEHLPIEHEYMVAVTAPGHMPRVRIVKGSELAAPVILDLDAVPAGAAAPPLGDERPPKLAARPGAAEATLDLRSNTPGAQLGLLVGFTPGVKVIDVDVEQPRRFHVVLLGYEVAELVVKGRHFEEQGGALVYQEQVTLVPSVPAAVGEGAVAAEGAQDAEADDADADPEADVVLVDAAAATPAAPAKSPPAKKQKRKPKKRR